MNPSIMCLLIRFCLSYFLPSFLFFFFFSLVMLPLPLPPPPLPPLSASTGMRSVIAGMDRGVEGMRVGGSREIAIPAALA